MELSIVKTRINAQSGEHVRRLEIRSSVRQSSLTAITDPASKTFGTALRLK